MIVGNLPDKIEHPLTIPDNACEGHFPGRPLVPGVLQLQLVAEALGANIGAQVAVGGVPRVRFRKPIVPGDVCRLEAQRKGSTWRFRIIAERKIVTEGALEISSLPHMDGSQHEPAAPEDIAQAKRRLPHREPMLLAHRVLEIGDGWGVCAGAVSQSAPFARGPLVPALAAVEVAAQSLGMIECSAESAEGPPKIGLLVAVSNARLSAASIPVGAELRAQVQRTAWMPPMARAEALVTSADREVAACTLTTWAPDFQSPE